MAIRSVLALWWMGWVLAYSVGFAQAAETVQQDRRIEEQKRDELQPSESSVPTRTPTLPGQAQPPTPVGALPIYFLDVSQRYVTYHYDLAKAVVVMRGVDEEYINLEAQLSYLTTQRILPARATRTFDLKMPLRKGLFALALCRTLRTRGGIFFHLFPWSQRYALNELVYQGILSPGHPHDLVSGQEFVSTMSRAVEQLARERRRPPPPQRRQGS